MNILREAVRSGEVQVVGLCDVDQNQLRTAREELGRWSSDQPKQYTDFRECLQKEKPDLAIIATPDHWHALTAIEAVQNGAHIFLEKPISHTVKEGTAIAKAVADTQRACAVDFHRRYSPHNVSGMEFLKSGKMGAIKQVDAFVNYRWGGGQPNPSVEVPAGLDWDFYCGPAEKVAYSPNIHPRGWRQYLSFANGQLGDWGPHWFNQILWWTEEKAPRKVFSTAGKSIRGTSQDAPETQTVVFEFESFNCTWQHSILNQHSTQKGENVGVYFHGTEGTFHMAWLDGWTFYPADPNKEIIHQTAQLDQPDQQNIRLVWQDFLQCVKNGETPKASIDAGRQATNMALLGMLSQKIGRSIEWDAERDEIKDDPAANALLRRNYRGGWVYPG